MTRLQDKVVVIAGATSAAGRTIARALVDAGARVVVVGSHQGRLDELEIEIPGVVGERADLTDGDDVLELAMRVHAKVGDVDGVVHLVGGWRGGGGIPGQTEEDYRVLERSFTALRYASRVFWHDLLASDAGRIAIVSSTTVEKPTAGGANYTSIKAASESWMRSLAASTAGGANYTSIKAASESWMRSLADGFRKAESPAAAVTFRVTALAGLESRLADEVIALWSTDAAASDLNGRVTTLTA